MFENVLVTPTMAGDLTIAVKELDANGDASGYRHSIYPR